MRLELRKPGYVVSFWYGSNNLLLYALFPYLYLRWNNFSLTNLTTLTTPEP